ncbi:PIN domain-containing protein [Candidatus Gottesmanbacteria bacterium]|nr:PIN domain-containing protein [Candidatus Gottesmanbacteria bacterium]
MDKVIIDTDIVIDFLRINAGLLPRITELQKNGLCEVYVSSISIMELFAGKMNASELKMLYSLLEYFKVVSFDRELAQFVGESKRGKKLTVPLADYIIGLTSIYLGAELATRNKDHFKGIPKLKFFTLKHTK